jgi:hypothetical protein
MVAPVDYRELPKIELEHIRESVMGAHDHQITLATALGIDVPRNA